MSHGLKRIIYRASRCFYFRAPVFTVSPSNSLCKCGAKLSQVIRDVDENKLFISRGLFSGYNHYNVEGQSLLLHPGPDTLTYAKVEEKCADMGGLPFR